MDRTSHPDAGGELLERGLGGAVPPVPLDEMWAGLGSRLPVPGPRGVVRYLPLGVAAVAAAAALLVAAVLLFSPASDPDSPRLRLRVIDVDPAPETRPLSREEAAEIFYGTEAPVLLGSDLDAGVRGGG
jgi:hypothetical protein